MNSCAIGSDQINGAAQAFNNGQSIKMMATGCHNYEVILVVKLLKNVFGIIGYLMLGIE